MSHCHNYGPCPMWTTSTPDINLTQYSQVPCILLSTDPGYHSNNCASFHVYSYPLHLHYPQPFMPFTSLFYLTHSCVSPSISLSTPVCPVSLNIELGYLLSAPHPL